LVGLKGLEALLPLREEYWPAIDLQLCAFAQEGVLQSPGTEALLARLSTAARPRPRIKAGHITVEHERSMKEPWRSRSDADEATVR